MDLARRDPRYLEELAAHHVGGHLKVAPEHVDPTALALMKKPAQRTSRSSRASSRPPRRGGQGAVPRPLLHREPPRLDRRGDDRARGLPEAQRLPAAPGAGLHPRADGPRDLHVLHGPRPLHDEAGRRRARELHDRKMQRALMQFFKPENYFEAAPRAARTRAARDLIGDGCDALIPATPPREAIEARRAAARDARADRGGIGPGPGRLPPRPAASKGRRLPPWPGDWPWPHVRPRRFPRLRRVTVGGCFPTARRRWFQRHSAVVSTARRRWFPLHFHIRSPRLRLGSQDHRLGSQDHRLGSQGYDAGLSERRYWTRAQRSLSGRCRHAGMAPRPLVIFQKISPSASS